MPYLFRVNVEEFFTRELFDAIIVVADSPEDAEKLAKKDFIDCNGDDQQIECTAYHISEVDGYKVQLLSLDTFYFTFGTDELYPFQGGWVEITAPNKREAIRVFRKYFPNREGSNCYNAADCYDIDEFKNHTDMFTTGNLGAFCHARIAYEEG